MGQKVALSELHLTSESLPFTRLMQPPIVVNA